MNRIATLLGVVYLFSVIAGCATGRTEVVQLSADDPVLVNLSWMTGSWVSTEDNVRSEEHWTQPAGGTMFGVNRTIRDGKTLFFEYMRIEVRGDVVFFLASPSGQNPPTEFRMMACTGQKAVFVNPTHDFPKRITYWREGDILHATAEGESRGTMRSEVFQWQRARLSAE